MKQNQKSNQKFNSKLIFFGSLLILISVAFIFASGCVTDDSSSYTPPPAPPDIVLTKAPTNDPIRGGYSYPTAPAPDDYIAPHTEQTTNN